MIIQMKKSSQKAFTIVESVIAIMLVAFLVIAFFTSLTTSVNYVRRCVELRNATLILQEEISIIREMTYTQIQSLGGTFSLTAMSSLRDAYGLINKSPYDAGGKITKLSLELRWTGYNGLPAAKYITTLITEQGIDKK